MQTVHHLVSVCDSEQLMYARQFADADHLIDEKTSIYLDREESMCSGLHVAANKPKGVTYGRKRQAHDRRQHTSR